MCSVWFWYHSPAKFLCILHHCLSHMLYKCTELQLNSNATNQNKMLTTNRNSMFCFAALIISGFLACPLDWPWDDDSSFLLFAQPLLTVLWKSWTLTIDIYQSTSELWPHECWQKLLNRHLEDCWEEDWEEWGLPRLPVWKYPLQLVWSNRFRTGKNICNVNYWQ